MSIGASAVAITSLELSGTNPLPLLSAIVTGIGFLGAGAMIKTSDKIFGVTTAAIIWLFTIFGLLIGVGEFIVGLTVYVMMWAAVGIDIILKEKGIGSYQRKVIICTTHSFSEKKLHLVLEQTCQRFKLLELSVDKEKNVVSRQYLIEGSETSINSIPSYLEKEKSFLRCTIQ